MCKNSFATFLELDKNELSPYEGGYWDEDISLQPKSPKGPELPHSKASVNNMYWDDRIQGQNIPRMGIQEEETMENRGVTDADQSAHGIGSNQPMGARNNLIGGMERKLMSFIYAMTVMIGVQIAISLTSFAYFAYQTFDIKHAWEDLMTAFCNE